MNPNNNDNEMVSMLPNDLAIKEPHPVNQVTTFSKYLALALFVMLPFLGGYVGYQLALDHTVNQSDTEFSNVEIVSNSQIQSSLPTEALGEYTDVELPQTSLETNGDTLSVSEQYIKIASGQRIDNFYVRDDSIISYASSTEISNEGGVSGYQSFYTPIVGADADTFEVNVLRPIYARDKNFVYVSGQIIKDADPKTFVPLCGYRYSTADTCVFSKDADHVFWSTDEIVGADTKTFVFVFGGKDYPSFAADSSALYRGNNPVDTVKMLSTGEAIHFPDTSKIKDFPEVLSWADFRADMVVGDSRFTEWGSITDGTFTYSIYSKYDINLDASYIQGDTLMISKVAKTGDRPKDL